jgi:hypothetical protein
LTAAAAAVTHVDQPLLLPPLPPGVGDEEDFAEIDQLLAQLLPASVLPAPAAVVWSL